MRASTSATGPSDGSGTSASTTARTARRIARIALDRGTSAARALSATSSGTYTVKSATPLNGRRNHPYLLTLSSELPLSQSTPIS